MAGTRRRIASLAIAAGLAVTAGTAIALVGIGPASAFTPGEGTGKAWCPRYGGTSLGSYRDVYACKPGGKTAGKTPFDSFAGFQPTELANRYLYTVTGHTLFDNDVAGNFVALASASFALPESASGPHVALPVPGDVISMWGGRSKQRENGDHTQVAIVTAVAAAPGGWVVTTLNQGDPSDTVAARGFDTIAVSRNLKRWSALNGFYADFAWLKLAKPGSTSSPAPAPSAPAPAPAPARLASGPGARPGQRAGRTADGGRLRARRQLRGRRHQRRHRRARDQGRPGQGRDARSRRAPDGDTRQRQRRDRDGRDRQRRDRPGPARNGPARDSPAGHGELGAGRGAEAR